jgi:D-inositol-3-phosphate glycosyltransferase
MSVYVLHLAQELARTGVEVDVFSRRHDSQDPAVVDISPGARLIHIEAGPPQLPRAQLPLHLRDFYCNLRQFVGQEGRRYDLVHSHYWLSGRVGQVLAQGWETPHVATFHTLAEIKRLVQGNTGDPVQRAHREGRIAATADAIIVSDAHEREALVRLYGAQAGRVHVIPCGVDSLRFQPMEHQVARQTLELPENPLILFVGRLDPLKGLDLLLHIVAGMEEWRDLRLLIVGGDPEQEPEAARLRQMAQEMGLGERVRFEGAVPQEQLPLYYNSAAALVMPSYYESFGLVALEAMACGTPVVAARVGGLASLVRDWDTGCLVPGHCPAPFIQRLETLLSHPDLRRSMGEAAHRYARGFGWDTVARRTLDVYQQLQRPQVRAGAGAGEVSRA